MKVLITGGGGQLATDLAKTVPSGVEAQSVARETLDITDEAAVSAYVHHLAPDVVINAAAYTKVDLAQSEAALCQRVNANGPRNLARACAASSARLLHVSTDYVFDGQTSRPYREGDAVGASSVYGQSKLDGERAVLDVDELNSSVVRVSWLYGEGGSNFVLTMLRLMNERSELGIVADQSGSPTWTRNAAVALWKLAADSSLRGVWHWSDCGVASWYDLAMGVYRIGRELGLVTRDVSVNPIATDAYPTAATRPAFSALDAAALRAALDLEAVHWRDALTDMLQRVAND